MEKLVFETKPVLSLSKDFIHQMNFLHSEVGATEWSGLLYYKVLEGTIKEPGSLKMRAEHIFPLDVGSSTYTEYEVGDDVIDFYDEHEDAMQMKVGHVHTHHNMSTSPSGTDMDEIRDNVKHHTFYLSLIVNFSGQYTAMIGVEIESEGHQSMRDEAGARWKWEIPSKKECYQIEVDIMTEPEQWFIDQYDNISGPKTTASTPPELSFVRFINKKERGRFTFVQGLEKFAKKQGWSKKTARNKRYEVLSKLLTEWTQGTGIDYQSQNDMEKMLETISKWKNPYVLMLIPKLEELIVERKEKYANNYSTYGNNTHYTKPKTKENGADKSKDDKVQGRRVGQLGFRY